MDLSVAPRLQRQAMHLAHALLSHEERTTNPTRLYQVIGRAFARWRRRTTLVIIDQATRYEPLHERSLDELHAGINAASTLRTRLHLHVPDFTQRAIQSHQLSVAMMCMRQEILRRENAARRPVCAEPLRFQSRDQGDYIVRRRRSARGTHRQAGHL